MKRIGDQDDRLFDVHDHIKQAADCLRLRDEAQLRGDVAASQLWSRVNLAKLCDAHRAEPGRFIKWMKP